MFSLTTMPSTSSVFSAYTTLTASTMLIRTALTDLESLACKLLPKRLQDEILSKFGSLFGKMSSQMMMVTIDEYNGYTSNEVYKDAELYLSTRINTSVDLIKVCREAREKEMSITIDKGQKIVDTFENVQLTWEFVSTVTKKISFDEDSGGYGSEHNEKKSIQLSFNKKYKDIVLRGYLPYVAEISKVLKQDKKVVNLCSIGGYNGDNSINLDHPSTFETLAIDPEVKRELIDDLDRFLTRRKFYKRVGKVWKRGYLLYGPPGTGKSSLIAAMANYLKFDVYDLELTSLRSDSDLRRLLVSTANRSILVIEDIDCGIELENRQSGGYNQGDSQVTLSGLLNFVDGLWSSCGDERIIVFTTNYKERLDPALLRPGRMDMHIHLSYLSPDGFRILAYNYLRIKEHSLFGEIEGLIREIEVTPAEVAEELMKSDDADVSLGGLVGFLRRKKCDRSEVEEGKQEEDEYVSDSEKGEEDDKKRKRGKKNKKVVKIVKKRRG